MGNKKDLENQREVSTEEGRSYAEENGFLFAETSVLDQESLNNAFLILTKSILASLNQDSDPKPQTRPNDRSKEKDNCIIF